MTRANKNYCSLIHNAAIYSLLCAALHNENRTELLLFLAEVAILSPVSFCSKELFTNRCPPVLEGVSFECFVHWCNLRDTIFP